MIGTDLLLDAQKPAGYAVEEDVEVVGLIDLAPGAA
jgi:hypothetical protein